MEKEPRQKAVEDLLQRIRKLDRLTPSEKKIAAYFEQNYPLNAFETIAAVSGKVGVGKATIGRFITRLGYRGFPDLMKSVQQEMISRLESPTQRFSQKREKYGDRKHDQLHRHVTQGIQNIEETLRRMDPDQFCRAAELMANCRGKLFVMGSATSEALANYFHLLASYLRKDVTLVDTNIGTLAHRLADVSSQDTLFAITHQRSSRITVNVSQWFAGRGARVILLTDREVTAISRIADIQLVACSNAPLMFSSRAASFLLLEALVSTMAVTLNPDISGRLASFDEFFEKFSVFDA